MDSKTLELIAETLIEIRDEMRRNRPPAIDIQSHPERVRRVKDLQHPSKPYLAPVAQLAELMPMTK